MLEETIPKLCAGSRALRVVVLLGGDSSERNVSLSSGRQVVDALRQRGHFVDLIDPAEIDLFDVDWDGTDACFIALHGGAGEDGRIQAALEALHVPYTGSGPLASQLAMSKSAAKRRFLERGIATPPGIEVRGDDPQHSIVQRIRWLAFPVVVKPDSQGCSLGVSLAREEHELKHSLSVARRFEPNVIAERFISGREFTVGLIDRRPLPMLEIVRSGPVFDYESKFGSAYVAHVFTHDRNAFYVVETAIDAAEALDTRGLVRVDLILDDDGKAWVLEVNTVPGLTEQSLAPMMAEKNGMTMPLLCEHLVLACMRESASV